MPYDFTLDMSTKNSNSVIINNIAPNSKVLEFGCAHGRMTKYLAEKLNCKVTIVEIDPCGFDAEPYCVHSLIGEEFGDIDGDLWYNTLRAERYDYIIFADVLEHLKHPKQVLRKSADLLEKDGTIWVSIPNIGHNAVLIDLLNGKFIYRDVGLLDRTHITFFTKKSLEDMVRKCKLKVVQQENLLNVVDNTEFGNSYHDVPFEVADFLQRRENGEVYQFVWGLKK
jgi:O-antigen biosynthesis protein